MSSVFKDCTCQNDSELSMMHCHICQRTVCLITKEHYSSTRAVIHNLYLSKLLLHPHQIERIEIEKISDSQSKYFSIVLLIRSIAERNVFIFKIQNLINNDLRLNPKRHSKQNINEILKKMAIITLASNSRAQSVSSYTQKSKPCVIWRWRGIAMIDTETNNEFVAINVVIEPYQNADTKVCDLPNMAQPHVFCMNVFSENVNKVTPTKNREIRAYELELNTLPKITKFKTVSNKQEIPHMIENGNDHLCRWPNGFCPKQRQNGRQCTYKHLDWLEPNVCDGNDAKEWETKNLFKWIPAGTRFSDEFVTDSDHLMDVLQYCDLLRIEFVSKNRRSFELMDDRMNKIFEGKVKDDIKSYSLTMSYPNNICFRKGIETYESAYCYKTQTNNDNIKSVIAYMKKWNDCNHHNISFALKAIICNWPRIVSPEDVGNCLLENIDSDLQRDDRTKSGRVVHSLWIIAQNKEFRKKYLNNLNITLAEMYMDAKDLFNEQCENEMRLHCKRMIHIYPHRMQLSVIRTKENQIFNGSEEGRAYSKLSFVSYEPSQFAEDSDTLQQIKKILSPNGCGIVIADCQYKFMWYTSKDCMESSVTMICPQLLPCGYTLSGLRRKYHLNTMLNQRSRMEHLAALETTAIKMKNNICLQCIAPIKDKMNVFKGCGIINAEWLKKIMIKSRKKETFPTTMAGLRKLAPSKLINYLTSNGIEVTDKDVNMLIIQILSFQGGQQKYLQGDGDNDEKNNDKNDNFEYMNDKMILRPIEAVLGNIHCILVPYPQEMMDEIIKNGGFDKTDYKNAKILLPESAYTELCHFEYQRNYHGEVLYFDESDDDVQNAEECDAKNDGDEENKNEDLLLLTCLKDKNIPSYLIKEVMKAMEAQKKYKNPKNDKVALNEDEIFLNAEIPPHPAHKLVKPHYKIPFCIYEDTKYCELLALSPSLISILEYHRSKDDDDEKYDNLNEGVKQLQTSIKNMINDNVQMMKLDNLKNIDNALRFVEIFNKLDLFEELNEFKLNNSHQINPSLQRECDRKITINDDLFAKIVKIRNEIWKNMATKLEIPFITEPYLSRTMLAVCDFTNSLPAGTVWIQLKTLESSPKKCNICASTVDPFWKVCKAIVDDNCGRTCEQLLAEKYVSLFDEEIVLMESGAHNPCSLKSFKTVHNEQFEKLFPKQNILIFSSKDVMTKLCSNKNEFSFLNEYGRAKTFDVIVQPQFKYVPGRNPPHVTLSLDNSHNQKTIEHTYLGGFIKAFYPSNSSQIYKAGFDQDLRLKQPDAIEQKNELEIEYEDSEDEEEQFQKCDLYSAETEWIFDKNVSTMEDYVEYFIKVNQNNHAQHLRDAFIIESQSNIQGMDSRKCRPLLKLYEHFKYPLEFAPALNENAIYSLSKFPHFMLDKPMSQRKHCSTTIGIVFDEMLKALPDDLRNDVFLNECGINQQLIHDPQRDYNVDIMEQQQKEWIKMEKEKQAHGLRCKECDKRFRYFREVKDHMRSAEHKRKMEELQSKAGDENINKYVEKIGYSEEDESDDEDDQVAVKESNVDHLPNEVDDKLRNLECRLDQMKVKVEEKLKGKTEEFEDQTAYFKHKQFNRWASEWDLLLDELKPFEKKYDLIDDDWMKEIIAWKEYLYTQRAKYWDDMMGDRDIDKKIKERIAKKKEDKIEKIISDMGFSDRQRVIIALKKCGWDETKAINWLVTKN